MRAGWIIVAVVMAGWCGEFGYWQHGRWIALEPLLQTRAYHSDRMAFKDPRGERIEIADRLIVGVKKGGDIKTLAQKYGLTIVQSFGGDIWLLRANNVQEAIAAANALYHEAMVRFAHPDVLRKRRLR